MTVRIPERWGDDTLSGFIEKCRSHALEVFAGANPQFSQLVSIDELFRRLASNLDHTKDWFPAFFFFRAHSSFLASAYLCMCGQLPEAYMVSRGAIENALYGLYFSSHKESVDTWLQRNDSADMKRKVRDEFKTTALLDHLKSIDSKSAETTSRLIELTIDFGAHPNMLSVMSALRISTSGSRTNYNIAYISGNTPDNLFCLKACAQTGANVLSIFQNVYRQRFDILGITTDLDRLKATL
jgi:hypothetical protein